MPQRIVLTGGPSTGKTAIIQALEAQGQLCMQEISREVTRAARQQGIEQLFVSDPLAFSEALFAGKKKPVYRKWTNRIPEGVFGSRNY